MRSLAALPWLALSPGGGAHHPYGDARHQQYLHWAVAGHGLTDEDWCAKSFTGDDGFLAYLVEETLQDGSHARWDGIGNGKLDLWPTALGCDAYGDWQTRRTWIEVEFWANSQWTADCGAGFSCAKHYDPTPDGLHRRREVVRLMNSHIDGGPSEYHQTISHEFGHVLGLADPPWGGPCNSPQGGSIMHTFSVYGCPYVELPTIGDAVSVLWNVMLLED